MKPTGETSPTKDSEAFVGTGTTRGVHHLGLTVDDLDGASAFFVRVLAFEVVGEKPAYPARFVSDGTVMLTLWQRHGDGEFDRRRNTGLHHLALRVADHQTLTSLHLELRELSGVTIEFGPNPLGSTGTHMMCLVPGGVRLEFVAPAQSIHDPTGSRVAFTAKVKARQTRHGSRASYDKRLARRDWSSVVTPELREFISQRDSFYFGTASANAQPYVQHRGGPVGFLEVLDEHRLAFADYRGNKQYISVGNLDENDKAFIFLMDYEAQRRIKLWGRAEVIEDDPGLFARLDAPSTVQRAIVFHVRAWDENCSRFIPIKHTPSSFKGHHVIP